MLAYAAGRPRIGARQSSPNAMLFVICGHIVLIAAVMSARMVLPPRALDPPTTIIPVSIQKPPPANKIQPDPPTHGITSHYVPPQPKDPTISVPDDSRIGSSEPGPAVQPNPVPLPPTPLPLPPAGVTRGAQLLTPPSELKPPYPQSKLVAGEEATLVLRLTIDDRGKVVAVDPVGRADAVFLAAARRYLIAHWRYSPAMRDGRAIASSITVRLRFELDG